MSAVKVQVSLSFSDASLPYVNSSIKEESQQSYCSHTHCIIN